jgi:hypothetical protein
MGFETTDNVNEGDLREMATLKFLGKDLMDTGTVPREKVGLVIDNQRITPLLDELVAILKTFDQVHLKAYRDVPATVPVDMCRLDKLGETYGLGSNKGHVLYLATGEVFRALCHPLGKYGLL